MRRKWATLVGMLLLGLSTGCGTSEEENNARAEGTGGSNAGDATSNAIAQAPNSQTNGQAPTTQPQMNADDPGLNFPAGTAPVPLSDTATRLSSVAQPLTCTTTNYVINVRGGTQPSIVVRDRNQQLLINSPAQGFREKDDSTVYYNTRGEVTYYLTVYANNACNLRVFGADGVVTTDEDGFVTVTPTPTPTPTPTTDLSSYRQGYQQGYQRGFEEGFEYRKYNAGFNPERAFLEQRVPSVDPSYRQGYRDGFNDGFRDGYERVVNGMW